MGGARGRAYAIDDGICGRWPRWRGWQWQWRLRSGDGGGGWREVASGVVDLVDPGGRSDFEVRRKSFSAAAAVGDGGRRLAGGGEEGW
nr:hypothetical protein [Tanacetum cinerariifolium]